MAALFWGLGVLRIAALPDTIVFSGATAFQRGGAESLVTEFLAPTAIMVGIDSSIVFLITAAVLALAVSRFRKIVLRHA